MRPSWSGHIRFGLISIPVSLYTAVDASQHVSFRLLHRKDRAPIQYKKFCSKEDIEVPNDEIVRGYEMDDDAYAPVEKEDIEKAEAESGLGEGELEVLQFVEAGSIDPLSYQTPYFVAPKKGGDKAYAVLREALNETGRVGIVRFRLRKLPSLGALVPGRKVITLEALRPYEELRSPASLSIPEAAAKPAEVKMARLLIDQLSGEAWRPAEHPNEYKKALRKLLASRQRFSLKASEEARPAGDNVVDLMSALRESLARAKGRPKRPAGRRRGAA